MNIVIEFCIFKLVWVPNFSLDLTIGFFGPNFPKKGISSLKLKIRIFACIVSMAVSYYIQPFCRWTNRHNGICNKTRKRRVRRLLMMVKPRRCAVRKARKVRKEVRRGLMMGEARRRKCAQGAQFTRLIKQRRCLINKVIHLINKNRTLFARIFMVKCELIFA